MRYVSTRGAWAGNPQPFSAILLEGLAPDGGLAVPQKYPRFSAREMDALRARSHRARRFYPDLAFAVLSRFIADIPAADLKSLIDRTYTKETFFNDAIMPVDGARAGHLPDAPVERADARVQRHRAAASRQPVRVHAREGAAHAQHPRRDVRGHRQLRRVRDARQARNQRLHAVAARPDEPVPAGADVFARRAQHPQHRDRRRFRRLPGHRESRVRRRRRSRRDGRSAR